MIKACTVAIIGCLGVLGLGVDLAAPAQGDPDQNCTPPQTIIGEFGLVIGSRTTCVNPDGSYVVCNFPAGALGNRPPQCNYHQGPAPVSAP